MRQMLLLVTWTVIGTTLIVSGVYLGLPGRNLQGNPRAERELASCELPDEAEVRLYQGDPAESQRDSAVARGDSAVASAAIWFSVTHDPKGLHPERQIVYRDRPPALYDLVCDSVGVVIRTDAEPITLTAEQAQRLRERPAATQRPDVRRLSIAGALVLAGGALLWVLRPRPEDASSG